MSTGTSGATSTSATDTTGNTQLSALLKALSAYASQGASSDTLVQT